MSEVDNITIKVRALLQERSIKLWLEPYCAADVSVESEIDKLSQEFSQSLGIPVADCKLALTELQDGALRKLAARREYETTGRATFSVRLITNEQGTQNILEVMCSLSALGVDLQGIIADKLELSDSNQVKCISAGKILEPQKTLEDQGLKNNQQLMVIVSQLYGQSNLELAMYDRIRKIKMDVESVVDSSRQYLEMEDQDGNPVFLPPEENRALLMAMSFCEKARVAMKRQLYDEALILLLEADDKFSACSSKILEAVDNYALVNLDIVWCYLCLKNVTQLPDAQRRLEICEKSFRRSYGEDMTRLISLKGNACPERALLMRLHLMQGVVLFHQNRRAEAREKLELATSELAELKVDESAVAAIVEMGYKAVEARLGLRSSDGSVDGAIAFIHDRRDQLKRARSRSKTERIINKQLIQDEVDDKDWVNPRSVCELIDMGYSPNLAMAALRKTRNNVSNAIHILQTNPGELLDSETPLVEVDLHLLQLLEGLGFDPEKVRAALEATGNNVDRSVDFLVKSFNNEGELQAAVDRLQEEASAFASGSLDFGASTSAFATTLLNSVIERAQHELEALKAYRRFNEDLADSEMDYLDLPLVQEEEILAEYKHLLE